ncbi:hypothetical protein [Mycobacterium sp. NPDC006124]|uniref:hypothetical protein n=1 Tax=Mycobacterium sp. NPDC006124 TaxID=3156729 RepID=UPI0033AC12F9
MRAPQSVTIAIAASGFFLAVLAAASPAGADPLDPAPPPPAPAVVLPAPGPPPGPDAIVQAAAPAAPVDPAAPGAPAPAADPAAALAVPPNGVPHLASPDALPPGSTMVPQDNDSPNVSYLKDLWQAVQNHEISGKEALIMGMAQRGMNTPIPGQAPGPNVPLTPGDPAPAPPPAPVADPTAPTP